MLPAPAPMVLISIIGSMTGCSAMPPSVVMRSSPPLISEMSVLVPPMSTPSRLGRPPAVPRRCTASAPPAGPDVIRRTGKSRDASTVSEPPFDCINSTVAFGSMERIRGATSSRYRPTSGMAAAFNATVLMRSNSRTSRHTSCDAHTWMPGNACRSQSLTWASFPGFTYEFRKQTATASAPVSRSVSKT